MTTVYFVRHAKPNFNNHDDASRELSEEGTRFCRMVTAYLDDKEIDVMLSSPYKRSLDTIMDFSRKHCLEIQIVPDFRERKIGNEWIPDFEDFTKKQWDDFHYKRPDGESLFEVQKRNVGALQEVLQKYSGKNIVIGTHGTALSTILNYYGNSFGYDDFKRIQHIMPWIVVMTFDGETCLRTESFEFTSKGCRPIPV